MMSKAMVPLRSSPEFVNIVSTFENPLIGILVGAIFTAIIQSSSASVGILQALAKSGVITLPSAIYVLFGQNIGTCITAVLASIGTGRNAKRTTIIHLSFNIIGTIIFVAISMLFPFAQLMQSLTPTNIPAQIANVHTVFNVVTTILLLPFGNKLVNLAYMILPEKDGFEDKLSTKYLDASILLMIIILVQVRLLILNYLMKLKYVKYSSKKCSKIFELIANYDEGKHERLLKDEKYIDYLNKEIIQFTTNAISSEFPIDESKSIGLFLKTSGDLERVGDHAMNIAKRAKKLHDDGESFSDEAIKEISIMNDLTRNILEELNALNREELHNIVEKVDIIEDSIDNTTHEFSVNQLKRLRNKKCTVEHSALYTETLIDFERIGDHGLNIAIAFNEIKDDLTSMA